MIPPAQATLDRWRDRVTVNEVLCVLDAPQFVDLVDVSDVTRW